MFQICYYYYYYREQLILHFKKKANIKRVGRHLCKLNKNKLILLEQAEIRMYYQEKNNCIKITSVQIYRLIDRLTKFAISPRIRAFHLHFF